MEAEEEGWRKEGKVGFRAGGQKIKIRTKVKFGV